MDGIILQLTHDNDVFQEQWPDIYTNIDQASIPNGSKSVLNALTEYVLQQPVDPSPYEVKYFMVTKVVKQLTDSGVSIDIHDLVNIFTRTFDRSRTDQWHLNFLRIMYRNLKIGKQLSLIPLKTDLIEQILQSLQKKIFIFNAEDDSGDQWQRFVTQDVFSSSVDDDNILNKQHIITQMQTSFKQFYQHAVCHSPQSSIWSHIAATLNKSSPEIFCLTTITLNEMMSSNQLIQSYKNNNELIQTNFTSLLTTIEHLLLASKYDDVYFLFSQLLIPNLSIIDLEMFLRKIIELCAKVEQRDLFCSEILSSFVWKLNELNVKKHFAFIYFDLIIAILKLQTIHAPDISYVLLRRKEFYPWKELTHGVVDVIQTCISYEKIINDQVFSELNKLEDIIESISEKAQIYPSISKILHPLAVEAVLRWSNSKVAWSTHVYRMGKSMLQLVDLEQVDEDLCIKLINALQNRVHCSNKELNDKNQSFFTTIASQLGSYIGQLKRLSNGVHAQLATLFLSLLDHSLYDDDQNMTLEHITLITMLFRTATSIFNENDARLYEPCLDRMYNDAKNKHITTFYAWWAACWNIIGMRLTNVAKDHIEQFLEYTFNFKCMDLTGVLMTLCVQRCDLLYAHFDNLINTLLSDQGQYLSSLTGIFSLIIREQPEIILSTHIDKIFSSLEALSFNNDFCLLIQSLSVVANYRPYLFDAHQQTLLRLIIGTQNLFVFQCFQKYLIASMLINNESKASEYLHLLTELFKTPDCSSQIQKEILHTCLLVGLKYKHLLTHRRQDFAAFESNVLLDYIDDTIINDIDQTIIKRAQDDMQQIQLGIDRTKVNSKKEKSNVCSENVPSWSFEVAKLLNQRSRNDWRLLGKHHGFSSNEIKHWAMQIDPCMALLNEWFMTHTIEEAVYSLVKVLHDINRQDAEEIIRKSVTATGRSIPNDLSCDIKRRPPIYLSFHSSEQTRVIQLKDQLENAGYACQMCDEQTKLDTIETSIRGAKLIVCYINTLFTQSEYCRKIFQSNFSMKKPFILLHTEEDTWSPSEFVHEYSSIQFSSHQADQKWHEDKFIEILGQIRYHIAPDYDMITEQYRHWFVPRLDTLIFLKSSYEHKENHSISLDGIPLIVCNPQIIISYSWDCQKDVLHLYKQLTQLGYRLWLDIFQMTGEDSLIEKYHLAIRQALCLLVCITPKYMTSIHCQHELSLANTLKKPVVPLLLEETSTWPLPKLVSSLFVGEPYIDFRHTNEYDRWTGKPFEMLLAQLQLIVPGVDTNKSRHLLEIQRPVSACKDHHNTIHRPTRISSAPNVPCSRACSLM